MLTKVTLGPPTPGDRERPRSRDGVPSRVQRESAQGRRDQVRSGQARPYPDGRVPCPLIATDDNDNDNDNDTFEVGGCARAGDLGVGGDGLRFCADGGAASAALGLLGLRVALSENAKAERALSARARWRS